MVNGTVYFPRTSGPSLIYFPRQINRSSLNSFIGGPLVKSIITAMSDTNLFQKKIGESKHNEMRAGIDGEGSNISDCGISLKAISLIIHIDYF